MFNTFQVEVLLEINNHRLRGRWKPLNKNLFRFGSWHLENNCTFICITHGGVAQPVVTLAGVEWGGWLRA
jgi:hypothetical protein